MKFSCQTLLLHARRIFPILAWWMVGGQLILSASVSSTPLLEYHSRSWQADEGLPMDIVQAVAQTPDGYLWVGTPRGLARFDGIRFRVFDSRNTPELKNSSVTALCRSADGGLWIGTAGGLTQLKKGQFVSCDLGMTNNSRANTVKTIFEAQDGSLWVGTLGGLLHQQNGRWKLYTDGNGLRDNVVRSICEGEGQVWIGTALGVCSWKDGTLNTLTNISDNMVRAIFKDREGAIWFGLTTGLCRLHNGQFTRYTRKEGLPDSNVSSIFQDRRGDLWVGTYGGLTRFVDGRFVTEKDNRGSFYDQVNAID